MRDYCGKRSELAVIDDACVMPKWEIEKVLTVSLVNKKTGEVVYTAPYDKFAVVLTTEDDIKYGAVPTI